MSAEDSDDLETPIPEGFPLSRVFESSLCLKDIPVTWLTLVHLNPDYPELWTVVMANVSSKLIRVKIKDEWVYTPFKSWVDYFIRSSMRWFWKCRNSSDEEKGETVRVLLFDHRREVEASLHEALLGPMRSVIKKANKLR